MPRSAAGSPSIPTVSLADNYALIFTDPDWYMGYVNAIIYVAINVVISVGVACPPPMPFRGMIFSATAGCSSGS